MKIVSSLANEDSNNESETDLVFYDPKEEARIKKEKEMMENLRNRQNLKRDAPGQKGAVSSITAQSSMHSTKIPN